MNLRKKLWLQVLEILSIVRYVHKFKLHKQREKLYFNQKYKFLVAVVK